MPTVITTSSNFFMITVIPREQFFFFCHFDFLFRPNYTVKPKKKKKSFKLPWWCVIFAWILLVILTIGSAAMVTFYGISFKVSTTMHFINVINSSFAIEKVVEVKIDAIIALYRRKSNVSLLSFSYFTGDKVQEMDYLPHFLLFYVCFYHSTNKGDYRNALCKIRHKSLQVLIRSCMEDIIKVHNFESLHFKLWLLSWNAHFYDTFPFSLHIFVCMKEFLREPTAWTIFSLSDYFNVLSVVRQSIWVKCSRSE